MRKKINNSLPASIENFLHGRKAVLAIEGMKRFNSLLSHRNDNIPFVGTGADVSYNCGVDEGHIAGDDKDPLVSSVAKSRMDAGQRTLSIVDIRNLTAGNTVVKRRGIGNDDNLIEELGEAAIDVVDETGFV